MLCLNVLFGYEDELFFVHSVLDLFAAIVFDNLEKKKFQYIIHKKLHQYISTCGEKNEETMHDQIQ